MLVSSGVQHELICRYNGHPTKLDIVEGTFKLFKIETRKLLAPLKLIISYKQSAFQKLRNKDLMGSTIQSDKSQKRPEKDLNVFYSFTNPKPEESNCDGHFHNPLGLSILAPGDERFFTREYLFIKMQTTTGC